MERVPSALILEFQSTLSVRRATYSPSHLTGRRSSISIHALRKESDVSPILDRIPLIFQSTLSVRRATVGRFDGPAGELISIHALRKESDFTLGVLGSRGSLISIHALRMESDLSVCDADVAY